MSLAMAEKKENDENQKCSLAHISYFRILVKVDPEKMCAVMDKRRKEKNGCGYETRRKEKHGCIYEKKKERKKMKELFKRLSNPGDSSNEHSFH